MKAELIIAIISIILSMGTAIYTFVVSKRERKSEIYHELTSQANLINMTFGQSDIISPYGLKLGLQDKTEIKEYNQKINLFFQHFQLLNLVFSNEQYLKQKTNFEKWIKNELKPWILSDENLLSSWYNLKKTNDFYSKDFIDWVTKNLEINENNEKI